MKQKRTKSTLFAFLLPVLLFSSCAPGEETGLSDGKYPITFTAQVDGRTATRATSDNSWTGGEEVAVQIGSEVKRYVAATDNTLSAADGVTPWYWQNTTETKTVSAWYPYSDAKPADGALKVKADQSGYGYGLSDHLEAAETTVTFAGPALTFKHRTAKVVVTLKAGDGVSAGDLSGATVKFLNLTGVEGDNGTEITSKKETANGSTTYAALLIPQQIQNQKFIQVTIGTGDAARDYYYTPTGDNDANLEAGKQYTYTITVKKTGLEVVANTSVSWSGDNTISGGNGTEATFKIYLAAFTAPTHTSDYKVTNAENQVLTASDGVYSTASNAINISLSASEGYRLKKFLTKVTDGICKQKMAYAADTRTYTCTFYDIRSDLRLSDIEAEVVEAPASTTAPKVGDYYYADGTWSETLTTDNPSNPCIGIVFKVGTEVGGDNTNNYNTFFIDNAIHGYVVALTDAHTAKCAWGGDGVLIGTSTNQSDYLGYSNSLKILAKAQEGDHLKPDNAKTDYPAMYYISEYQKSVSASITSSGWYFPSTGQLKDIYDASSTIQQNISTAGGSWFQSADYLSSSEYDRGYISYNVGYVSFSNGNKLWTEKDEGPAYVRAILTF